jgi:hypothetical protein
MNEFVLALWTMTASHYQWEMPGKQQPLAIVQPIEIPASARELSAGERRELQTAVERMARCATGTLRLEADFGWYVPDQKTARSCARLSATHNVPAE